MAYTNSEKYTCVVREVAQRERVYPRLIAQGKMTEKFAKAQIEIMTEIAEDYFKLKQGERLL